LILTTFVRELLAKCIDLVDVYLLIEARILEFDLQLSAMLTAHVVLVTKISTVVTELFDLFASLLGSLLGIRS